MFKSKSILALCMFAFSCFANQDSEPTSVVLNYGDSSLSADIQANRKFHVVQDNESEHVEFSGGVTKEYSDYIVNIHIIRKSKIRRSSRELNTTVLMNSDQLEKPLVVGIENDEFTSITLR
ncbi:hypothetical protein ACXHQ0_13525 [Vibrio antiquarius]|uniref:hypothetical protein n=1 Tax=Vibrio diabolicus subgroup TaxID=2315253 RepID=UPI00211B3CB1|nr:MULTISPECIES: hypothetical protein [Vibrio diabolicus subgroup]MCG6223756.1 hypothetical protein [Vibrio diabolicus]MCR9685543.1 hypothetical protein [Vibrio antiquarius]MDV5045712.1 hypothetical protein [Vibrio diabolicus]